MTTQTLVRMAVISCFLTAGQGAAIAQPYRLTSLPASAGFEIPFPMAINDFGVVVGYSYNPAQNVPQATIWNQGIPTFINTPGFAESGAYGINAAGQVVGSANFTLTVNDWHAIVWSGDSAVDLGPGAAFSINKHGQVAGTDVAQRATIWNGITPTTIGVGPDQARAINLSGQIAGAIKYDAVIWNDGSPTFLQGLGGTGGAQAQGINDRGVAVGYSWLPGDVTHHATLWNGSGVTDLGSLGGGLSRGFGINNDGVIVGDSFTASGYQSATLWSGTNAINLNDVVDTSVIGEGWRLALAMGINSQGAVVGIALNDLNGQTTGFLLSPVPEPSTYALMIIGLFLLSANVRREAAGQLLSRMVNLPNCQKRRQEGSGTAYDTGAWPAKRRPTRQGTLPRFTTFENHVSKQWPQTPH